MEKEIHFPAYFFEFRLEKLKVFFNENASPWIYAKFGVTIAVACPCNCPTVLLIETTPPEVPASTVLV